MMNLDLSLLSSRNYTEVVREENNTLLDLPTLRRYEANGTEKTHLYNLGVLTPEGKLIAFGFSAAGPWDPILKPGHVEVTIKVDKTWRNNGIGSWLLEELEHHAMEHNAEALQTNIKDTRVMELDWAAARGFRTTMHSFGSQLDVTSFDPKPYRQLLGNLDKSGIRFTSLQDYPQTEATYNRFWDFWWELVSDVPNMETKPQPDNQYMTDKIKDLDKGGIILAVDTNTVDSEATDGDKWVALSMTLHETGETFYNSMTGVSTDYRGQGLAKAVKIKAIEYAAKAGAKYIRTHNDSSNTPMLSINQKLGYKQKPGIFALRKQLV